MDKNKTLPIATVALKSFRFNGRDFQAGDEFVPSLVDCTPLRLRQLTDRRYVNTGQVLRASAELQLMWADEAEVESRNGGIDAGFNYDPEKHHIEGSGGWQHYVMEGEHRVHGPLTKVNAKALQAGCGGSWTH